jgi:hypothetical protein
MGWGWGDKRQRMSDGMKKYGTCRILGRLVAVICKD